MSDTPRCDSLDLNTLDNNDIRAWRTLARECESALTVYRAIADSQQPPEATATSDRRISVGWALLEALRRREAGEATSEDQSYAYLHDAWHGASPTPQVGE
jgi:hypothetical protein